MSLGDSDHEVAALSGALGTIGLVFARRFAAKSVAGLAFCLSCRKKDESKKNPFLACKVLAGVGFFCGLTLLGVPLALLMFLASYMLLRKRLRAFRQSPSASPLKHALDAAGTLAIALMGTGALVLVMGGVAFYSVYFM